MRHWADLMGGQSKDHETGHQAEVFLGSSLSRGQQEILTKG